MTDMPPGWERVPLRDLGNWFGGGTPSKARNDYWENGTVPWLSPKDMGADVIAQTRDHITAAAVEGSAVRLIPAGSVAIVVRSGILERKVPIGLVSFETTLNQDMKAVVPIEGVDSRWVAWGLRALEQYILRHCRKAGTTVASIEIPRLMDLEFPVPPAEEQQRIVAALEDHISRLDQGRGLVDRCVIRTQHLRHAVLDRLFSPEFVEKSATSASLGDFVVDSRGGWSRGARHLVSTEKGVPYLKMNNITIEGVLNVEDYVSVAASADEHRKYQLEIGDVLFNSKNSAELVGKTAAVTSEVAGWVFNENIICIRFHPSVIPEFAAMQMNSNKFRRHMEGIRSATTNVAAVYMRDLRRLPFWIPSITKQEQIVAEYMAARDSLKRLELATRQTISRAAVLRKSLLREAFAGQLVPQDPEAEPASALLERVRAERATVPAPKSRARLTGAIPGQTGSRGRTKSKNTSEQETLL